MRARHKLVNHGKEGCADHKAQAQVERGAPDRCSPIRLELSEYRGHAHQHHANPNERAPSARGGLAHAGHQQMDRGRRFGSQGAAQLPLRRAAPHTMPMIDNIPRHAPPSFDLDEVPARLLDKLCGLLSALPTFRLALLVV